MAFLARPKNLVAIFLPILAVVYYCSWKNQVPDLGRRGAAGRPAPETGALASQAKGQDGPRPGTWTQHQHCVGEICVSASQTYGNGLSIATNAKNAAIVAGFPTGAVRHQEARVLTPPPFFETQIEGKGIGLRANASIRKGDIVMVHTPTVLVHLKTHFHLAPGPREGLYVAAVQHLPAPARRRFMRLAGATVYDKVDTNGFRLFVDGQNEDGAHLGCYPESARLNHDCRPNLQYYMTNITQTIVAVRDIAVGEELTVSYIDGVLSRAERQERLHDWGFTCSCAHCRLRGADAAASDARIRAIEKITKDLEERDNPAVTAATGAQLAALYEAEKLDVYLGHVYTQAALNYALFGVEDGALEFATKAAAALEREFGPDAPDIAAMRELAANPKAHWSWELKKKRQEKE
ncbi:SET domain protein [Niveomyces insectorum RCEF 264]|uniref:SET domain protein n=1 Tax=Niveomyces insectorum RCEF 264 TaxID=1081102 RepID=A0A167UQQ4_9HYPO|nr:SET domain protein [Niveomyces insectorum RCEF 264]